MRREKEEIRNDAYEIRVGDVVHLTVLHSPVITTSVTRKDKGSPLVWPDSEPFLGLERNWS